MDGKKRVDGGEGLGEGGGVKNPENDEVAALFSRVGKKYMDEGGWLPACAPAGPTRAPAGPSVVEGSSRA